MNATADEVHNCIVLPESFQALKSHAAPVTADGEVLQYVSNLILFPGSIGSQPVIVNYGRPV